MHFALLGNMRVEPIKGLDGVVCPICKQPVYARCGEARIAHWAHKSVIDCDPWQEPETQWHRDWKNRFGDMQEQMHEKDGARHIADVKTPDGTIVEFRHRFINGEGQRTRQAFFGETMFWVVDCASNLKRVERFKDNRYCLNEEHVSAHEVWSTREAGKCFPLTWINCQRFVFFDFGEEDLWYIFPRRDDDPNTICMRMSKDDFVATVKNGYAKFRERCVDIYRVVKQSETRVHSRQYGSEPFALPSLVTSVEVVPQSAGGARDDSNIWANAGPLVKYKSVPKRVPKPAHDIWPAEFDKSLSLALTVDLVTGWLLTRGIVQSLVTDACVNGEANATGCCAVHCATLCGVTELYWARKRAENTYGKGVLCDAPQDADLKSNEGGFIGMVEYHVEERLDGKVKLYLRNFKRLAGFVSYRSSRECIWRLDPALRSRLSTEA